MFAARGFVSSSHANSNSMETKKIIDFFIYPIEKNNPVKYARIPCDPRRFGIMLALTNQSLAKESLEFLKHYRYQLEREEREMDRHWYNNIHNISTDPMTSEESLYNSASHSYKSTRDTLPRRFSEEMEKKYGKYQPFPQITPTQKRAIDILEGSCHKNNSCDFFVINFIFDPKNADALILFYDVNQEIKEETKNAPNRS